jgi:hypothetical protein
MARCVCEVAYKRSVVIGGNYGYKKLKGQRAVMMATCVRCDNKWPTPDRDTFQCPKCKFRKINKYVELIICPVHGIRGPQTVPMQEMLSKLRVIDREPRNIPYYVERLAKRRKFSHSRWNDGEWLTVLGYSQFRNSNGCTFEKPLADDMLQVLKRNLAYDHALLAHALRKYGFFIRDFLREKGVEVRWVKGDVFLNGMLKGNLFPLIEQIRKYRVLYVGPAHCRKLPEDGWFDLVAFVEPPPLNAHRVKEKIVRQVLDTIEKHDVEFIGWSSGLASKVFIDEVFLATGGQVTQIDFGSSFDGFYKPLPHIQKRNPDGSRSYIRKGGHDWPKLHKQNTEGK